MGPSLLGAGLAERHYAKGDGLAGEPRAGCGSCEQTFQLLWTMIKRPRPLMSLAVMVVPGAELAPGPAISDDDTARLARLIRERAGSYHHPVGTCAMGPSPATARSSAPGRGPRDQRTVDG